jgi:cyclopropane-fatty-acyl-phospholipid synthase
MSRMPVAEVVAKTLGRPNFRVTAYDGSASGPAGSDITLDFRSPKALSYLITAPGSLGLARAYISGELEISGSLYELLSMLWTDGDGISALSWPDRIEIIRNLDREVFRLVEPPAEEYGARRLKHGFRHSKSRDAAAISHHYDVGNTFYEWVLGPSMTYTCACYPEADSTLEEAQAHKYDLVARKLDLKPGMRLLDVGCGWGGMVRHAAKHYGVQALGVTLSRQQAEWAAKAIADDGLTGVAEVRYADYRDVREGNFDAVSSIGLTEHIGLRNLPAYFRFLRSKVRPQGRLLNHSITRPTTTERVHLKGFIDSYVFPDGEIEGVGAIISAMQDNGFEIRHDENLREHYAKTLHGWCDNLDAHWDEAVDDVGLGRVKVWALYMAGSRLGFERHKLELHQVLGVRVDENGDNGMPLRYDWGV